MAKLEHSDYLELAAAARQLAAADSLRAAYVAYQRFNAIAPADRRLYRSWAALGEVLKADPNLTHAEAVTWLKRRKMKP